MRLIHCLLFAVAFCSVSMSGCSSNTAEVAPRTQDEVEEYKRQAYGAEEESQTEAQEAEAGQ